MGRATIVRLRRMGRAAIRFSPPLSTNASPHYVAEAHPAALSGSGERE
jgi:hypothetical protein